MPREWQQRGDAHLGRAAETGLAVEAAREAAEPGMTATPATAYLRALSNMEEKWWKRGEARGRL